TRRMQMWDTYLCAIEDYEQAASWEAQLIDLARESGDPLQLIGAKLNLSITKTQSGDPLGGRQPLEEAYLLAQRVGYRPVLTKVGCNLLYTHYLLGSLPDGIALGQELLPKVTSDRWRVMTLLNLGWVELESGRSVAR